MFWDQPSDTGPRARSTTYGRGKGDVPKASVWTEPSLSSHFQETQVALKELGGISKCGPNLNNIAPLSGKDMT